MGMLSINAQEFLRFCELRHPDWARDTEAHSLKAKGSIRWPASCKWLLSGACEGRDFHTGLIQVQNGAAILTGNLVEFSQIKYIHIQYSKDIAPGYIYIPGYYHIGQRRTYTLMLSAVLFVSVCSSLGRQMGEMLWKHMIGYYSAARNNGLGLCRIYQHIDMLMFNGKGRKQHEMFSITMYVS